MMIDKDAVHARFGGQLIDLLKLSAVLVERVGIARSGRIERRIAGICGIEQDQLQIGA